MTRGEDGRPGDDDESLERWEDELADLDWDDDVDVDLTRDPDGDVPLDDEGRPLRGPGALAPVWQRAIARLIDVFIVFSVVGPLTVLILRPDEDDGSFLGYVLGWTVFLTLAGLYEIGTTAWWGRTVGKMLLGVRVVRRSDGGRPTLGESAVRFFPWLLLYIPSVGMLLWMIVYLGSIPNARRQGWHDKAASTLVVVA